MKAELINILFIVLPSASSTMPSLELVAQKNIN